MPLSGEKGIIYNYEAATEHRSGVSMYPILHDGEEIGRTATLLPRVLRPGTYEVNGRSVFVSPRMPNVR